MTLENGQRATTQPAHWYDGAPIANWPDPQFVGTVLECLAIAGGVYYRVKYDSGRTDIERSENLRLVPTNERITP
jgi:hypothetical protein